MKKPEAKAEDFIGLRLSDDHFNHVCGLFPAADMFNALGNTFRRRSVLNTLHARRRFYTARVSDDDRVLIDISQIRQLPLDLNSMDLVIADKEVAMTVFCGISERFEHLIVAVDTFTSV